MLSSLLRKHVILILLLVLVGVLLVVAPSFGDPKNLLNIIKKITIMGIVSCGMTLVIVSGGLDLSVGSVFSLTGCIAIMLQKQGLLLALTIPFVVAIAIGFINGFLTTRFNVNSIIVTLGMLSVVLGIALILTNGRNQLGDLNHPYARISQGTILGLPNYVIVFFAVAILLYFILQRTTFGRFIYLTGENLDAARIAGIRVDRVRIAAFALSAATACLGAILLSSRMTAATPYSGSGFEFDAITAVLVGGNSITGGKGGIYNTVLGVLIISVLINGMILLNWPFAVQEIVKGLLIIIAVTVDLKVRKRELA